MTDREANWAMVIGGIALVVVIFLLFAAHDNNKQSCADAGGELKRYARTTLCVSPDGRILDTSK